MSNEMDRTKKLAYLRIDDEVRSTLQAFQPRVKELIPGILDEFYSHILKEEHLKAMFTGEAQVKHAQEAQSRHWLRMFSGRFDDEYFESVNRIGKAHCSLGLEPSWYIGGYSLVKQALYAAVIQDAVRGNPVGIARRVQKATALLQAIDKAITLDMDLAISVYLEEKDRDFGRRLGDLSNQFDEVVTTITNGLADASGALATEATGLEQTAEATASQVATAMSGTEQANANVQAVAAAIEQMSASIAEISSQVSDAAGKTDQAVSQADQMSRSVGGLHEAADKVGGIIRLIEEIAEQTNLLALNATIEAARAGDAGKGFAVVAGEVKHLAQQTAGATGEIAGQIKAIQDATADVSGQIESITTAIGRVGETSSAIATAIEEQTSVTQEISRSVAETTAGVSAVQEAMQTVADAADRTRSSASQLTGAANEVRSQSNHLDNEAKAFIDRIRMADRREDPRHTVHATCTLTLDGMTSTSKLADIGASSASLEVGGNLLDVSAKGAGVRGDGSNIQEGAIGHLVVEGCEQPLTCTVTSRSANRIGLKLESGAGTKLLQALGVASASAKRVA